MEFLAALRTVPTVDQGRWDSLGLLDRWAVAARLSVLVMTAASAAIGGLLALADQRFDLLPWTLCLLGLLLAHATSNLVNDYVDFRNGVDEPGYARARYGTHVLVSGYMQPGDLVRFIVATGAIAVAVGVTLAILRGPLVLGLMLAGALLLLFYTWPMKALGLGEPAVLLTWGPLMVAGSYFVASGEWSWPVAMLGLVYALGPTAVLFGKHVDKLEMDKAKGIRTVPVRLGRERTLTLLRVTFILQFVLIAALVLLGMVTPWLLLVGLALPGLRRLFKSLSRPAPESCPDNYPEKLWPLWYTPKVFVLNRNISGAFVLALLIAALSAWV